MRNTACRYREVPDGLVIVYEDDGIGIPDRKKEKTCERGYGKHTGLGLYTAREILSITNMVVTETGEAGKGARFEIWITPGNYRISKE